MDKSCGKRKDAGKSSRDTGEGEGAEEAIYKNADPKQETKESVCYRGDNVDGSRGGG